MWKSDVEIYHDVDFLYLGYLDDNREKTLKSKVKNTPKINVHIQWI